MKTLILMRHAKSDWKQPGLADHDRPLNARGLRAAPAMGRHAREAGLEVDVILASSAVRVQQTVELLRQEWAADAELLTNKSLYLATPEQIVSDVQALHDDWVHALVVAHNPGLSALASWLAQADIDMPTAAMAVFKFASPSWLESFSAAERELAEFWKPRDLIEEPD